MFGRKMKYVLVLHRFADRPSTLLAVMESRLMNGKYGIDASRFFLMSSVPTGRPYVSPGQRPGKPGTMDCKSPKGANITMNANATNLKTQPCWNAKMDERKNEPKRKVPPRWGTPESGRSETQADSLGWHSVATLWRNRIGIALCGEMDALDGACHLSGYNSLTTGFRLLRRGSSFV